MEAVAFTLAVFKDIAVLDLEDADLVGFGFLGCLPFDLVPCVVTGFCDDTSVLFMVEFRGTDGVT